MTCPVCLNHITRPRVTPCNHEFCSECLDTWLTCKLTCPLCRAFVDDVEELYRKFRLRVEEHDFISTGPFWRQIEQDRAVLDELVIHVFDQGHHACKEFIIRNGNGRSASLVLMWAFRHSDMNLVERFVPTSSSAVLAIWEAASFEAFRFVADKVEQLEPRCVTKTRTKRTNETSRVRFLRVLVEALRFGTPQVIEYLLETRGMVPDDACMQNVRYSREKLDYLAGYGGRITEELVAYANAFKAADSSTRLRMSLEM